jgi:hypothetical protein
MTFTNAISLTASLSDPNLFGNVFGSPTYWPWKVVAKLLDGIELREQREIDLFEQCTGRKYDRFHRRAVRRLILLAGRRAGKDRFISAVAIWRAALCADWRKHISAGEQAVCLLLGGDRKQANILSRYCSGLLRPPMIRAEVTRAVKDAIEFRNGSSLEVATNSASLVRGRSAICLLGSEACHWKTDENSASSDEEVVAAALPSLSLCPDQGLMVLGSSVHRRRGYMYKRYRQLWADDSAEDLVWLAPSAVMNPRLPQSVVDKALAEDSNRARAEFMCEWRSDLSDFVPEDAVTAATDFGVYERAPMPHVEYHCHCDAAGGTGADSLALAISHRDTSFTIDAVREFKPRFTPASAIAELATLVKSYRITKIFGDRYAIGFHSAEWKSHGVEFEACERTTSENYLTMLPLLLAGRIKLVDNVTLRNQLTSLERRPGDGAREQVSHPPNGHDDVACACAGAIVASMPVEGVYSMEIWDRVNGQYDVDQAAVQRWANSASQPSSGPQAPGSVDLGNNGYRAQNYWNPTTEAQDRSWELYRLDMTRGKT